ncbi:vanadium-dependent haloperoxidase [Emticicia sp. BO119]|uniref:vanadium-dependent haloperoxidase n=1 Tax=Emticicia sp. BO119 TaxID=2757768 RepID=UPI0015F0D18E|nr:vanadium-dependent haloperoxidase [Emticicia sp. BO119]MBA4853153.1 vanadium-dependent haloperoxidase [Emticicia sp. BO119]
MGNLYAVFLLKRVKVTLYAITCIFTVYLTSCKDKPGKEVIAPAVESKKTNTYDASLAINWTNLQLRLIKSTPGYAAPVAARSLAYTSLAFYESVVYGLEGYQSLAGKISGLTKLPVPDSTKEYNWGIAANAAISTLVKELYTTTNDDNKASIDSLRRVSETALKTGVTNQELIERSINFGADIAKAIWDYSKTDGGNEGWNNNFPTSYKVPVAIGSWEPVSNQKIPLLPYWGKNRNFSSLNNTVVPSDPIAFSFKENSIMYNAAKEVYTVAKTLTDDQKEIAHFWTDASITPGGHSFSIANIVLKKEKSKLDKAAEVYIKLGLTINDAFVACWKSKYNYNLMAPITYIKQAISPTWSPYIATQPVPSYTSDNATSSGASAEILTSVFGDNYAFTDNTYQGSLPNRTFKSFEEYANEATIAQLFGGVQYRMANENGQKNGKEIAKNILKLNFKK